MPLVGILIHCIDLDASKVLGDLPFFEILSTLLPMFSLERGVFRPGLAVRRMSIKDTTSHLS